MKGGGDAVSAARAVLQTGEFDYAWNMQVEDDILLRLEQSGKGRVNLWVTGGIEHMQCNFTDPWTEVDGERSSIKTTHPLLSDAAVRQALNLLVDRAAVQEQIYGRQGQTTANFLNAPARFRSEHTRWEFNVDKANADPRGRRLEARPRRAPRQGRQETEIPLPDVHQRAPPEDPGHREAGLRQGRHRDRDQVRRGLGLLRLGCRQS